MKSVYLVVKCYSNDWLDGNWTTWDTPICVFNCKDKAADHAAKLFQEEYEHFLKQDGEDEITIENGVIVSSLHSEETYYDVRKLPVLDED